ncbi:MAG: hypothetical protein AB1726_08475 [Planctomycetota bacterium]
MSAQDRDPTPDELLAMAYVDGELPPAERAEFAARLLREPALARDVAALQRLAVIARRMAPPEPADQEWARLEKGLLHRGGMGIGFAAVLAGGIGLAGWAAWRLAASELGLAPKILLFLLLGGFLLLFLVVLRNRRRTLPYDPYTGVER